MGLLGLLKSLLRALAAYWELKEKRFEHDLREQSRARIEALQDELENLRNRGDVSSTIAADRLRNRIYTERAYFESLPDADFKD